jgi:hypothetical protein
MSKNNGSQENSKESVLPVLCGLIVVSLPTQRLQEGKEEPRGNSQKNSSVLNKEQKNSKGGE